MGVYEELSFNLGQRGGEANRQLALKCSNDPKLLEELIGHIHSKNVKIIADICEVCTETAKIKAELLVPYAHIIQTYLHHKNGRVSWEAMHCFALIAHLIPSIIEDNLDDLSSTIETFTGVIVRDYAIECLTNYATINKETALRVYPHLKRAFSLWEYKHAVKFIQGFEIILKSNPDLKTELSDLLQPLIEHKSASIKKAVNKLLKKL